MSLTVDLTTIVSNTIILIGKANYQRWTWSVEGTACMGLFWSAYDGTNTPTDTTAAQKEASAQREMKALSLIMKTVDTNIALEIQSMADVSDTAASEKHRPNQLW